MKKQKPIVGDVFWVPIDDQSYVLGQIIEIQKNVLNSITCAFYNKRVNEPNLENIDLNSKIISIQFVTKDLFSNGIWIKIDNKPVAIKESLFPYRDTQKNGWIGAKMIGSRNIVMFLSAYYGLRKWDEMKDKKYYDYLLFNI